MVKHASASQAEVTLRCSSSLSPACAEEGVELRVSDDGCGFDPSDVLPHRMGLEIIRERAQSVGATLMVESEIGSGTNVLVVWHSSVREERS